jgi:4-hydroxybenzoate polyprenyltransferase
MAHSTLPSLEGKAERAGPQVDRLTVRARPLALGLFLSLRPSQWTKNLFVFFGLLFGQRLLDPRAIWQSCTAFAIFCALSGVVYLVNDVADRGADRQHPLKRLQVRSPRRRRSSWRPR